MMLPMSEQPLSPLLETPDQNQRRPDPGSPGMAVLALISLIVLVTGTFLLQQQKTAGAAQPTKQTESPDDPSDPFVLSTKLVVKMGHFAQSAGPTSGPSPLSENVLNSARTAEERFRAAIAVGEVEGAPRSIDELLRLKAFLDDATSKEINKHRLARPKDNERDELLADIRIAQRVYENGGASLTGDEVARLQDRHGWFGKLLTTTGLPDSDPARANMLSGGIETFGLLVLGGLGAISLILAGLAMFIVALVRGLGGKLKPRFMPPAPGGSVYLETAALFFAGFIALKFITPIVSSKLNLEPQKEIFFALAAQWAILPVIFWPVARGVPLRDHLQMLGLHRGEGVMKEIISGILGYLAGVPIMLLALVFSLVVALAKSAAQVAEGDGTPPSPENPVVKLVMLGGPTLFMLYILATIWAPLVEECVFRGSFFRHLRAFMPLVPSAIISAIVFGLGHGYEWMMLGPVIAIGFNFAMIREWRGSLIGPITAHALHNGTLLAFVITLFSLISK